MTRRLEEMKEEIYTGRVRRVSEMTELNKTHRKIRKPRMKGRASVKRQFYNRTIGCHRDIL
jgi:hypothetical protein